MGCLTNSNGTTWPTFIYLLTDCVRESEKMYLQDINFEVAFELFISKILFGSLSISISVQFHVDNIRRESFFTYMIVIFTCFAWFLYLGEMLIWFEFYCIWRVRVQVADLTSLLITIGTVMSLCGLGTLFLFWYFWFDD